ncbi:MAG: 2-phosphosulfolactate phosphatase family protein [Cyanobacteria bacterium P01_A01_bin.135]
MKLSVFHTPEQTPADTLPDCAIAIDVLRATTTIATALAHGAEAVQAFSNIDLLLSTSTDWPADKRIRVGERGGSMVEGCDMGNSPLDYVPERVAGKRIFLSTTNGTRCLERIAQAKTVLTAALVNRHSATSYLLAQRPETVWLVGSGWEGSYSLEDTVCAGAIAAVLAESVPLVDLAGNDEVVGAIALFEQWAANLEGLMHQASHGQRLLGLNNTADLVYCARLDSIDVLPKQSEAKLLKAG